MFLTVHTAAGIIIGQYIKIPWLAFIAGFFSHLILDAIPHGDDDFLKDKFNITKQDVDLLKKFTIADVVAMMIVFFCLFYFNFATVTWSIIFAIAGSALPDLLTAIYILSKFRWFKNFYRLHLAVHQIFKKFQVALGLGVVIQIFFLLIFLGVIIIK